MPIPGTLPPGLTGRSDLNLPRAAEQARRSPEAAGATARGADLTQARRQDRVPAARAGEDSARPEDAVRRAQTRADGERSAAANERLGQLQAAGRVLEGGLRDLDALDAVARRAESAGETERSTLQAEADRLRARLERADADEALAVARRAQRRVEEAAAVDSGPRPTLTLRPRPETPSEAAAAQAERVVQEAVSDRRRAADEEEAEARRAAPRLLAPATARVDDADSARATRAAVADARARGTRLGEQLRLEGDRATAEARPQRAEQAPPRARGEADARETARQVAGQTTRDPARALAAQPFLTVEAALRVLG